MFENYASYIWACYGVTVAVWLLNFWLARRSLHTQLETARRRQAMNSSQAEVKS